MGRSSRFYYYTDNDDHGDIEIGWWDKYFNLLRWMDHRFGYDESRWVHLSLDDVKALLEALTNEDEFDDDVSEYPSLVLTVFKIIKLQRHNPDIHIMYSWQ